MKEYLCVLCFLNVGSNVTINFYLDSTKVCVHVCDRSGLVLMGRRVRLQWHSEKLDVMLIPSDWCWGISKGHTQTHCGVIIQTWVIQLLAIIHTLLIWCSYAIVIPTFSCIIGLAYTNAHTETHTLYYSMLQQLKQSCRIWFLIIWLPICISAPS